MNSEPESPSAQPGGGSGTDPSGGVVEITLTEAGSNNEWAPLREVAEIAQISVSTLRRWYGEGRIESRLEPGPRGDRRIVRVSEVLQVRGMDAAANEGRERSQGAIEGTRSDSFGGHPVPPIPGAEGEAEYLPIKTAAWDKMLEQLGNLHEAGQQLAEARERAARAEERCAFEIERRKLLEERISELESVRTSPTVEDGQVGRLTSADPSLATSGENRIERTIETWIPIPEVRHEPEKSEQPESLDDAESAQDQEIDTHEDSASAVKTAQESHGGSTETREPYATLGATRWHRILERIRNLDLDERT